MSKEHTEKTPRICMVVFSCCPADPRVRREAEALVDAGMEVDIICLRDAGEAPCDMVGGVRIIRLPLQRKRGGKMRYLFEYAMFIAAAGARLSALHLRRRYDVVHVHNMPDILVLSALLPRLTGAKLILDLHDPMPEVYMAKYGMPASHPMIRVLRGLERASVGMSHLVLTPNEAFRRVFHERGAGKGKIEIIMNAPDLRIFDPRRYPAAGRAADDGRFVIMYHGTIVERHGLDTALHAVKLLRERIPGLEFHVFGDGDYVDTFLALREDLELQDLVKYNGKVSLETIAEHIAGIDLGLVPNKKSVFTEINLPTRLFEYLCMGKPVIAPATRGIQDYFPEDALMCFERENPQSLADAIHRVWADRAGSDQMLRRGIEIYEAHQWDIERQRLVEFVRNLVKKEVAAEPAPEEHAQESRAQTQANKS